MNQFEKLEKKISETQRELREVNTKIGGMAHTPKYDPSYSESKLHNWKQDAGKLQERLDGFYSDLAAAKADPKYVAGQEAKRLAVRQRLDSLRAEHATAAADFNSWRAHTAIAIVDGEDPAKLAAKEKAARERLDLLGASIVMCQDALKLLIAK